MAQGCSRPTMAIRATEQALFISHAAISHCATAVSVQGRGAPRLGETQLAEAAAIPTQAVKHPPPQRGDAGVTETKGWAHREPRAAGRWGPEVGRRPQSRLPPSAPELRPHRKGVRGGERSRLPPHKTGDRALRRSGTGLCPSRCRVYPGSALPSRARGPGPPLLTPSSGLRAGQGPGGAGRGFPAEEEASYPLLFPTPPPPRLPLRPDAQGGRAHPSP